MTSHDVLTFLSQHQPLPYDSGFTGELIVCLKQVLDHCAVN